MVKFERKKISISTYSDSSPTVTSWTTLNNTVSGDQYNVSKRASFKRKEVLVGVRKSAGRVIKSHVALSYLVFRIKFKGWTVASLS